MSALKDSSIYYIIEKWAYGHIDYWELDYYLSRISTLIEPAKAVIIKNCKELLLS